MLGRRHMYSQGTYVSPEGISDKDKETVTIYGVGHTVEQTL